MSGLISQLRESLDYNPSTGALVWRERPPSEFNAKRVEPEAAAAAWNAKNAGRPALNCRDAYGYLHGSFRGKWLKAHRVAWALVNGAWPDEIDHVNGDKTDNRISNLKNVSRAENARNMPISSSNSSGALGVSYVPSRRRWHAVIKHKGRTTFLGSFETMAEAVSARKLAQKERSFHEHHGGRRSAASARGE